MHHLYRIHFKSIHMKFQPESLGPAGQKPLRRSVVGEIFEVTWVRTLKLISLKFID